MNVRRSRQRISLPQLRPTSAKSGRAKAGAESAAKRKAKVHALIVEGIQKRRLADPSHTPTLAEVALASGVSAASVRRHCADDMELARHIQFRERTSPQPPLMKGLKADLAAARRTIIEQGAEFERLESGYRNLLTTYAVLERRVRAKDPQLADEFRRSIANAETEGLLKPRSMLST
jgi:AraC-like DNA-binding protein